MLWSFLRPIVGVVVFSILIILWLLYVRKEMIRKKLYIYYNQLFLISVGLFRSIAELFRMLGIIQHGSVVNNLLMYIYGILGYILLTTTITSFIIDVIKK